MNSFFGWFQKFANLAIVPEDDEGNRLKKQILTIASLIAPSYLFGIGLIYLYYSEPFAASLYTGFAMYTWINLFAFVRLHRNLIIMIWALSIPALLIHMVVAFSLGDFIDSGAIVAWGLAFPTITGMVFVPIRQTLIFFLWTVANVIISVIIPPIRTSPLNLPMPIVQLILILNLIAIGTFIMVILTYFVWQRNVAFGLLRQEQNKSEALLLNILPADIAAILKNENRLIAEHFDGASILFADVVGFTPMSATMSPVELVNLLNEVFSYFDGLVEKYQLEKIKTIGDCYMVAAGVPRHRHDHAQALVQMALEMQDHVKEHDFLGRQLNFRIGINSGPVVAGVIGRKKFIYDLWGDAVNTASRMESHGSGGTIQITQDTFELIKDEFDCEAKGTSYIKGKGDMAVWTVLRKRIST